jgi:hypothetical protein
MFVPRYESLSEEAFALASLKEFVKLWGSVRRATFQIECNNGEAILQFSSQLGAPADRHFLLPYVPRHPQQCPHADESVHHHPRQKSQKQRERDLARAAAHRASQENKTDEPADPAKLDSSDSDNQIVIPPKLPPHQPNKAQAAVSAVSQPVSVNAAPAVHEQGVQDLQDTAAAAAPLVIGPVSFSEVQDEFLIEECEVKIFV